MIPYDMSSESLYSTINIERNLYSYGFELKDEGSPYTKFAVVSKITNNVAGQSGLKVGDKIISINDEKVPGKDYISLRNIIRKSVDNRVRLKVLKEMNFQVICPDILSPEPVFTPMKFSFGRSLIPTGSTRDKITIFQKKSNDEPQKTDTPRLSNSCDCINKYATDNHSNNISNIQKMASVSVDNLMLDAESPEYDTDVNQTISQDPFIDDTIHVPQDIFQIQMPSTYIKLTESKSTEHIEREISLHSNDALSERISEPFDDRPIKSAVPIPKLDIPEFTSMFSIHSNFDHLSPIIMNNKSRSSNNIFEDVSHSWPDNPLDIKNNIEFGSMTNINCMTKMNYHSEKKLLRQQSLITIIPIKLRIVQFHDKKKYRGWTDYILEKETSAARFRKRSDIQKNDNMGNFIIKLEDINKFDVDSPHKRHKPASSVDDDTHDSMSKYTLMAVNSHVQLRFHFNPSIYQSVESFRLALESYKEIVNSFKAAENNKLTHSNNISLSQSSNVSIPHCDSQKSITAVKELNSPVDEINCVEHPNSATNSYKSNSKSSSENISATSYEMSQPSTKNIFKQAIGKIRPDKKVKVTHTYQMMSGSKAEFEEFKMQLESGHLPLELDTFNENGIHFHRYIYEVPRMTTTPKIPMIIYLCTEIIENIGLKVEGIYRKSGNRRIIQTLSNTLNKSLDEIDANLPEWNNVHAVGGTLKLFLRKLKQNLIPADLSHVLAYSCKAVDCDDPRSLSKALLDIRYHLSSYQFSNSRRLDCNNSDQIDCRWESLRYIMKHLSKIVSFHGFNNMDERAISICFNPVLMESWQNNLKDIKADSEIMVKALELILIHQDWLFNNWYSEKDCSWNSELVESAQKYAKEFIDRKYDFNIKLDDFNECVENKDVDINNLVRKIVLQSTMRFGDINKPKRRHSSHTPGERPVILRDNVDGHETFVSRRTSQTTEALDLYACTSWIKQFAQGHIIPEHKDESKISYIPSKEPDFDVFEPSKSCERFLQRRISLVGRDKPNAVDYSDSCEDRVTHSSQKSINSDNLSWQRL